MIEKLLEHATARPDAPAFAGASQSISYGELAERARAAAVRFAALGVRPGEAIVLPIGEGGAAPADELRWFYALLWLGAAVLPVYPEHPARMREQLAARLGARRVDLGRADGRGSGAGAADALRDTRPDRPLYYEYSSGTTGAPKMVLYTAAARIATLSAQVACYGFAPGDRLVAPRPWGTRIGLRNLARVHVSGGALVNRPFPETRAQLAALVEEAGVTSLCSIPAQIRQLLASGPAGLAPALRFLDAAGAPMSAREMQAVRESLTPNLHISYGCSESGILAHLGPDDPIDAPLRILQGVEGVAMDAGHRPLPPGTAGNLAFRADFFPRAFEGNPEATAERFRGGWFYPGDRGSVDASGGVRLLGRDDDLINSASFKIDPAVVVEVLERFPGVREAALVGVPDAVSGEQAVAFVVLERPIDEQALVAHCWSQLHRAQVPPQIIKLAHMPRNADGKVQRDELRRIYRDYRAGLPR